MIVMLYLKLRKKFRKAKKIPEKNIEVLKGIDRKIYVLTKCNTLVNRIGLIERRNAYLKKVKKDYNYIYGQRGNNYFNSIQKDVQKPKTKKKVSFSGQIESPSNKSSYKFINAFSTSYLKQNEPLFNTVFGKH